MYTNEIKKFNEERAQVRSYMKDMLFMLAAVSIIAIYYYGMKAFLMLFLSIAAAVLCEWIADILICKRPRSNIGDFTSVFTGAAIALMLPASVPLWMPVIGSIFAVAVGKLPFGDSKKLPFVPAAVGASFLILSFRKLFFTYPNISMVSSVTTGKAGFAESDSIAAMLRKSTSLDTSVISVIDILIGNVAGPMGASCLLVMIGLFIYLLLRRPSEFITSASFIAICCIFSVLFPRVLTGRSMSLLMEISSGLLLFSAIFFINDPVTSPKGQMGRMFYGAAAGVLTMIFRYFGAFEEGVVFVVLIMNAFSSYFERWGNRFSEFLNGKNNKNKNEKANKKTQTVKQNTQADGGLNV